MPELPEVEFAARQLRRWMQGRSIARAVAARTRLLGPTSPAAFAAALTGRTLRSVERRGKYLLLTFDEGQGLLAHLGMTGKLVRRPKGEPEPYSHARFELEEGATVHFRDPRKFGRLALTPADRLAELPEVARLGPDAWDAAPGAEALRERLKRTSRPVKVALMDQAVLAGLGNIQAAEALFRAGISPRRRADRLTRAQLERLAEGIRATLEHTLRRLPELDEPAAYVEEGAENPFLVYARAGEPCPRCGAGLRAIDQAGRTTFYCRTCQR